MEAPADQSTNINSLHSYLAFLRIAGVVELISIASATKTAPAPKIPEINPAIAGNRNCPNLFPARRILIANDLSSSRLIRETQAMVIGCPMPSEKPAKRIIAPSMTGEVEKMANMHASDEAMMLPINNL